MLNVQAILNQLNVNPQMQNKVMSAYETATELAAGVQTKEQALSVLKQNGIDRNAMQKISKYLNHPLATMAAGFADVNMGRGAIVIGLAAVIIGEVFCDAVLGKRANFALKLAFVVFGAIIYYVVIGIVIWLKMNPNDLKLFTAIIVAIFLAVPYIRGKQKNSFKMAGRRSALALATAKEDKEV